MFIKFKSVQLLQNNIFHSFRTFRRVAESSVSGPARALVPAPENGLKATKTRGNLAGEGRSQSRNHPTR